MLRAAIPNLKCPPPNYQMEMKEKVQYQVALAVTGPWQGTDRVKLYEELGWESLTDRRVCRRILQFHKIFDGPISTLLSQRKTTPE